MIFEYSFPRINNPFFFSQILIHSCHAAAGDYHYLIVKLASKQFTLAGLDENASHNNIEAYHIGLPHRLDLSGPARLPSPSFTHLLSVFSFPRISGH